MIYARTDLGVKKARVVEIDITVEEEYPTLHREQPYGLTKDQGYVNIQYDSTTVLENLANLIEYKLSVFTELTKAYDDWVRSRATADSYEDTFNAAINMLRGL